MKAMTTVRFLILISLFLSTAASAMEIGSFRLDAHGMVGSNVAQGTYFGVGVDFYTYVEERLAVGVGGFYTAGQRPEHDRDMGGGPFVSYNYPLLEFLVASARENIYYLDEHIPFQVNNGSGGYEWTHLSAHGMASITSLGLHLIIANSLTVSGGYSIFLPLNNSDLGKDRSGFFFGLAFAI